MFWIEHILLCIYKKGLVIYKINIFNSKHYPTPVKNIFFIKCFLYVRHVVFPLMVSSTPIYSHIRIFRETYEWRRSMHILAGLNLQTVPLAAVLRKSPFPKKWDMEKHLKQCGAWSWRQSQEGHWLQRIYECLFYHFETELYTTL